MAALLFLACAEADHHHGSCTGVGDYNHGRQGIETEKQEEGPGPRHNSGHAQQATSPNHSHLLKFPGHSAMMWAAVFRVYQICWGDGGT